MPSDKKDTVARIAPDLSKIYKNIDGGIVADDGSTYTWDQLDNWINQEQIASFGEGYTPYAGHSDSRLPKGLSVRTAIALGLGPYRSYNVSTIPFFRTDDTSKRNTPGDRNNVEEGINRLNSQFTPEFRLQYANRNKSRGSTMPTLGPNQPQYIDPKKQRYVGQTTDVPSFEDTLKNFMQSKVEDMPQNRPPFSLPGEQRWGKVGGNDERYKHMLTSGSAVEGMKRPNFGQGLGGSFRGASNNPRPAFENLIRNRLQKRRKYEWEQPEQPTQNRMLSRYLGGGE